MSKSLKFIFLLPTTYKLFNHWYPLIFVLGGAFSAFIARSPKILAYIAEKVSPEIIHFIFLGAFLYMIFLFYFTAHKLWFIPQLYCDFKKNYSEGKVSFFLILAHCFFNISYTIFSLFIAYWNFEAVISFYYLQPLLTHAISHLGHTLASLSSLTPSYLDKITSPIQTSLSALGLQT